MKVWYLIVDSNQDYEPPDVELFATEDDAKLALQSYINNNLISAIDGDQPIGSWEHALGFMQSDEHGYQAWIGSRTVQV